MDLEVNGLVVLRIFGEVPFGTEYNQENTQDIRCRSQNWNWAPSEHNPTALTQLLPDRYNMFPFQESNSHFSIILTIPTELSPAIRYERPLRIIYLKCFITLHNNLEGPKLDGKIILKCI
jgi:hypothetical protein